jgi:hypothetical protein
LLNNRNPPPLVEGRAYTSTRRAFWPSGKVKRAPTSICQRTPPGVAETTAVGRGRQISAAGHVLVKEDIDDGYSGIRSKASRRTALAAMQSLASALITNNAI